MNRDIKFHIVSMNDNICRTAYDEPITMKNGDTLVTECNDAGVPIKITLVEALPTLGISAAENVGVKEHL
jgi:hypothetical protein